MKNTIADIARITRSKPRNPDTLTEAQYAQTDLADLAEFIRHCNTPFALDAIELAERERIN